MVEAQDRAKNSTELLLTPRDPQIALKDNDWIEDLRKIHFEKED
jgi:hypothetical protein